MSQGGVAMAGHAVVIAGAGPTGMMLAAELTLAGTDVLVVEPLGSHTDVTVDLGPDQFVVRIAGFTDLTPGTPVRIDATQAAQHLFDITTGKRLQV